MKFIIFISLIFLFSSCSKPKVVLVCGDHVCINKAEAEQYFEENLSMEVKVIDKKAKEKINLIELNLNSSEMGNKSISVSTKSKLSKKLKPLSNEEVTEIKNNIKRKKIKENEKKIVKKIIKNKETKNKKKKIENSINLESDMKSSSENIKRKNLVDVCKIIEKCNIDEITKYLLKKGNQQSFPDITARR